MTARPEIYINKIYLNNESEIIINKSDIVIFVGPNNVGKSQALKDIYDLCDREQPSIVIKGIELQILKDGLEDYLAKISNIGNNRGHRVYSGLGYSLQDNIIHYQYDINKMGSLRNVFVAYLNTINRLGICMPADSTTPNDIKTHPIQYVASNTYYRKWISEKFKMAFGESLIPHTHFGSIVPLCIGEPVKLNDEYEDEQCRQEKYAEILNGYKQVQDQGDGIKSFVGILLYLMLDNYSCFLIDEPESFLHPPQARMMGQIIGETLSEEKQCFISTHSEELVKGLLDKNSERVKIVRITRIKDNNFFSIIDNSDFEAVWKDPLLKHSNIMSALFHPRVVLCESDSDCKMYSAVEEFLANQAGKYSETLYLHCGGKHRMAKIVAALRSIGVDIKLIPDIDVLNDSNIFQSIIEAFGGVWQDFYKDYEMIVNNLHSIKEKINRSEAKARITTVLDSSRTENLSNNELKQIRDIIKPISKWENIKKSGKSALPPGDAMAAYTRLDSKLKELGIFIVPVGELEGFVREIGNHGPEWVNKVLETYPNFDANVYEIIKKFVSEVMQLSCNE